MLFNSVVFLFVFLPILLLLYYLAPKRFKNYILLLFSLVFYAWGGVSYSIILIGSVFFNYFFVKKIESKSFHKKKWLITGIVFNIFVIVIFKYIDFITYNINSLGYAINQDFPSIPY